MGKVLIIIALDTNQAQNFREIWAEACIKIGNQTLLQGPCKEVDIETQGMIGMFGRVWPQEIPKSSMPFVSSDDIEVALSKLEHANLHDSARVLIDSLPKQIEMMAQKPMEFLPEPKSKFFSPPRHKNQRDNRLGYKAKKKNGFRR